MVEAQAAVITFQEVKGHVSNTLHVLARFWAFSIFSAAAVPYDAWHASHYLWHSFHDVRAVELGTPQVGQELGRAKRCL